MARRKRKKKKTALTPATNLKNKYISRVIIKQTSAITIKKKDRKEDCQVILLVICMSTYLAPRGKPSGYSSGVRTPNHS